MANTPFIRQSSNPELLAKEEVLNSAEVHSASSFGDKMMHSQRELGFLFQSDSSNQEPSVRKGVKAQPKWKDVKIHTPVMISKADLKKRHKASVKKYLSTDIWHQNRHPKLKEGLARNVVINLDAEEDCARQLQ